jgi:hypothetical protein
MKNRTSIAALCALVTVTSVVSALQPRPVRGADQLDNSNSPSLSAAVVSGAQAPAQRSAKEEPGLESLPTNAVLRLIEWKQRTKDEPRTADASFSGWKANILAVEKESETRYIITVEIWPDLVSKMGGVVWTPLRIKERWIADKEQGLRLDRTLGKTASGMILRD